MLCAVTGAESPPEIAPLSPALIRGLHAKSESPDWNTSARDCASDNLANVRNDVEVGVGQVQVGASSRMQRLVAHAWL
eukprot:2588592-Prymnesium_polylepis.1